MAVLDPIGNIPFSAKKDSAVVHNGPLVDSTFCADTIEKLRELLISCGWNLVDTVRATARVSYPLGFQFTDATGTGSCGCTGDWVGITTATDVYHYCSYVPGQTPVGKTCIQFPLGTTGDLSLNNLAIAINETSPFDATVVVGEPGGSYIELVAKLGGPKINYSIIAADGRFGVASGTVTGGGYTLDSVGPSPYRVKITGGLGFFSRPTIAFEVTTRLGHANQGTVSYSIDAVLTDQYTIAANPYSFAMWDGLGGEFNNFAVFSPHIPSEEDFEDAYCVTVIGPGNLPTQIQWAGFRGACSTILDGFPSTFGSSFEGPGVLCLRATPGGLPLKSLDGRPLVTAAYLMMASAAHLTPYVIGKLWDCAVVTDYYEPGAKLQIGSRNYICIGANTGAGGLSRGSLFFCVEDNAQPVDSEDGDGNGSKSGTVTATGSPDEFTIEWASGEKFDPTMVSKTITISIPNLTNPWVSAGGGGDADGSLPVVATVASPTTLITSEALNSSFFSAPYTCP